MLTAISNSVRESSAAFFAADDMISKCRLAVDFVTSRLLKLRIMPGRNARRFARLRGFSVHYRFNRGDVQSIREVIMEDAYLLPFDLPNVRTALDLGANIGLWSLWACRQFGLQQIVAVEPDPGNASITRENFQANRIPGEVIEAAVGDRTAMATFGKRHESNLGQVISDSGTTSANAIQVRQVAIADLLARFPSDAAIDLVKMDIEGSEQAILAGDVSWLSRVRALVIEWHPDRCDPRPLIAAIEAAGFEHHACNAARQDNLSAFKRSV